MPGFLQEYAIYALVFVAVFLVLEALYSNFNFFVRDGKEINLRLRKLKSVGDQDKVFDMLRYTIPSWTKAIPSVEELYAAIQKRIYQAGIRTSVERLILYAILMFIGLVILSLPMATSARLGLPGAGIVAAVVIAALMTVMVFYFWIARARRKRMQKFLEQLPDALEVLVRGLRAGHPVTSALELVTTEMPDPIGTEFGLLADEIAYGLTLKEALANMAARLDLNEVKFFAVCVSIQYDTGGNLAEILSNLSGLIRKRFSLMRKVKALSSEGRMSAIILSALPIITGSLIIFLQPSFYGSVSDDPVFWPTLMFMGLLYLFGVFVIRRMVDIKV